jgi:DNA-binding IclR family transcriptional regulator
MYYQVKYESNISYLICGGFMEAKDNVKVLEKGLIIANIVKQSDRPLGVNEISKLSSINLTTAFRLLQTLSNRGWIYKDDNDKYIVGHKISFVTERNNFLIALKEVSYYTMMRLTKVESQAMNLVIRENEKCIILQQSRTNKIIDYVPPKGSELPVYASASGKILLSEMPDILRDLILDTVVFKPLTQHTITKRSEFLDELIKVKNMGYAVDIHESQEQGVCYAVPVRGNNSDIIAALSFSGFIGKTTESDANYYCQLLKKASSEITENLFQLENAYKPTDDEIQQ